MSPIADLTIDQFVESFGASVGASLTQADFQNVPEAAEATITLPAGARKNERFANELRVCTLIKAVRAGCTKILEGTIDVESH